MTDYTYSFGGLGDGHDLPETLALPTLGRLPGIAAAKRAVDSAGSRRTGVLLLGPKGYGKTVGVREAARWFNDVQRGKSEKDSNYRRRYLVQVFADRNASYWDTALNLTKQLNPRYSEKVRARKKGADEIRKDLIEIALATERTLFLIDEAEKCSEDAYHFYRDFLAQAEEVDKARRGGGSKQENFGVGLVLVGLPEMVGRSGIRAEDKHRWAHQIHVSQIPMEQFTSIYESWLPGFSAHIQSVGEAAWLNYMASLLSPLRSDLTIRFADNHVRLYVLLYVRHNAQVKCLSEVGFDENLFEKAFSQACGGAE